MLRIMYKQKYIFLPCYGLEHLFYKFLILLFIKVKDISFLVFKSLVLKMAVSAFHAQKTISSLQNHFLSLAFSLPQERDTACCFDYEYPVEEEARRIGWWNQNSSGFYWSIQNVFVLLGGTLGEDSC